eukprot:scaffold15507_cov49-Phaeocystis_antarctica.AAC.4
MRCADLPRHPASGHGVDSERGCASGERWPRRPARSAGARRPRRPSVDAWVRRRSASTPPPASSSPPPQQPRRRRAVPCHATVGCTRGLLSAGSKRGVPPPPSPSGFVGCVSRAAPLFLVLHPSELTAPL